MRKNGYKYLVARVENQVDSPVKVVDVGQVPRPDFNAVLDQRLLVLRVKIGALARLVAGGLDGGQVHGLERAVEDDLVQPQATRVRVFFGLPEPQGDSDDGLIRLQHGLVLFGSQFFGQNQGRAVEQPMRLGDFLVLIDAFVPLSHVVHVGVELHGVLVNVAALLDVQCNEIGLQLDGLTGFSKLLLNIDLIKNSSLHYY